MGKLVKAPKKGSVVVVEFADGMHEYVTTPIRRILKVAGKEIYYLQTSNSRYCLEVCGDGEPLTSVPAAR